MSKLIDNTIEYSFDAITKSNSWENIVPIDKGWSKDKKYFIIDSNGCKFLLRISDKEEYSNKKRLFELLQQVNDLNINSSKPISFGSLNNGLVYTLLTWLDGTDAEQTLPTLSKDAAYSLGNNAGKSMKKLHTINISSCRESWWDVYQAKIQRKIEMFKNCPVELPHKDTVIQYVTDNMKLVMHRPIKFQHGDYHCGNMIITDSGIGIIDFDKSKAADPYDEFKCFCWNVYANNAFENGIINGYFDGDVPKDFFNILALYAAESLLGHMTWAMKFGKTEIETAKKVYNDILKWYNNFDNIVPSWYTL